MIKDEIIDHISTPRDLRLMSSALVSKKISKLKTKILLEMIADIITEYPNNTDFIRRKLIEKCDREGISIDEVSLEAKTFLQAKHVTYQNQYMLLVGLRVLCVLSRGA